MLRKEQDIILVFSDKMVRKGLNILLGDMNFNVISAATFKEIETQLSATTDTPALFIFPVLFENHEPAINRVRELRKYYKFPVPTILLNNDSPTNNLLFTDTNLMILPEQITPAKLREKISECMACPTQ